MFQVNPSRGFTWNIKPYFLWKIKSKNIKMMSAAIFVWHLRVKLVKTFNVLFPSTSLYPSPPTQTTILPIFLPSPTNTYDINIPLQLNSEQKERSLSYFSANYVSSYFTDTLEWSKGDSTATSTVIKPINMQYWHLKFDLSAAIKRKYLSLLKFILFNLTIICYHLKHKQITKQLGEIREKNQFSSSKNCHCFLLYIP